MTSISIQSAIPMPLTLLKGALDREKRILRNSVKTAKKRVGALAKSLAVDPERLLRGEVTHTDANDMDLLELEGELILLATMEQELAALESARICG